MTIPSHEIIGQHGDWLTLLHGATQHRGLFAAQLEHFRHTHRLLLVDLPGHGASAELPGPYGQVEYAQGVLAVLDAVGVPRTHLWGTHTGSAVSLLIARQQPQRVASLILEGAVLPGMPMPYTTQVIARARATAQAHGVEAAVQEWFRECAWFDVMRAQPEACRAEAQQQLLREFSGKPWLDTSPSAEVPSLVDAIEEIGHPTLLVNGEFDVPEFLQVAETLAARLPDVQRAIIPGAGGFPLWECPAPVNRLVKSFLAQHEIASEAGLKNMRNA